MKKIVIAILLGICIPNIQANNGKLPNDTIFKYKNKVIAIKSVNDSIDVSVMQPSSKTDSLLSIKPEPESTILYDGSNYNFAFSWKKRNKLHSHWAGFGMSFMNYDDKNIPNGKLKMSTSHNFSLNLIEYYSPIRNSNWLFVSGVGLEWSRYQCCLN